MSEARRFLQRLYNVFRPRSAGSKLDRELSTHLALLEDDFIRQEMPVDQAGLAGRRRFGGVDQPKEQHRDARSFVWVEDLGRDIRYAVRALARTPGFAVAAVLTLAIGIGGSTAVFSLIEAVLLRPLPVPDADRVVMVYMDASKFGFARGDVSPVVYGAWASQNDVFDALAASAEFGAVLQNNGEPLRISGRRVGRSLFDVLGAHALVGRTFLPSEDQPGGPNVVVLSFGLWQRRFGGDPSLVGRSIVINNSPYLVVGVMPKTFQFLEDYVGLWVPAAFTPEELTNDAHYLAVAGRMKPGLSDSGVRANLDTIGARAVQRLRERRYPPRAVVVSLKDAVSGGARTPMLVLLAAVGVVLLITSANLASLLLARAATRGHEIALRGALGASRGRVIRQLLTESAVLAASGLILGIVLARWSLGFLEQLVPPAMTLFTSPSLNGATLAVAAAVSVATGLLFGLAPALTMTRPSLTDALKGSGRNTPGGQRSRGLFVVAEVAMTLVLLVAAGLLLQTFYRMRYADLGVRPEGLLTLRTTLPQDRYEDFPRRVAFYDRVLDGVQRLPGVREAGRGGSERQGEERAQERGAACARAGILVRAKLAQAGPRPPDQPLLADVDPQRCGEHVEGVDAIVVVARARRRRGSLGGRRRGLRRHDLRDGGCRLVREGGGDEGGEPGRDQGMLLLHASPRGGRTRDGPVTKPSCREPRATPSTAVTRAMRPQQPAGGRPHRYSDNVLGPPDVRHRRADGRSAIRQLSQAPRHP